MLISENWIDATRNIGCGESNKYEPFTDNIGVLFKSLQKEHGRCVSKIYQDVDGQAKSCGWVFQKIRQYTDAKEKYLSECWITLFEKEDKIVKTEYPLFIGG